MTMAEQEFMKDAIALSFEAMRTGRGGPYGAVVVKDGSIIGRGMNEVTSRNDPTHHAEMAAIRAACQALNSFTLEGCELYTSCEPCPMCMAAAYWARLDKVYYGNTAADAAKFGFNSQSIYDELAKSQEQRQLPMQPLMQQEALAAFEEWANKADRTPY
jgi:guanine deaminase